MRWSTRRLFLAIAAVLLIGASGCGDSGGTKSFSCSYGCPANEAIHGTKSYTAVDAAGAEALCEADTSISCPDTFCSCS